MLVVCIFIAHLQIKLNPLCKNPLLRPERESVLCSYEYGSQERPNSVADLKVKDIYTVNPPLKKTAAAPALASELSCISRLISSLVWQ